jgi:cell division protein FtsQ
MSSRAAGGSVSETSAQRFAARARARRWPLLRNALVLLLVLSLAGGAGWALLRSSWLAVDDVRVRGMERVDADHVLAAAAIDRGTPLLRVDTDAAAARVASIPEVASVSVRRDWPHGVDVVVTEREPLAAVHTGEQFRFVDAAGVVFGAAAQRPRGLPLVDVSAAESQGQAAGGVDTQTLNAALAALDAVPRGIADRVRVVRARTPDDVVLQLTRAQRVVWGGAERADRKATVLRALLKAEPRARIFDVSAPDVPTTRGGPTAEATGTS